MQVEDFSSLWDVAKLDSDLCIYSIMQINSPQLLTHFIAHSLEEKSLKTRYPFVIVDKRTNEVAGSTAFMNISTVDSKLEVGSTWIGRKFQKTGLNRYCKLALLTYAFEKLGVERLEFKADERNANSRRAIEALGAKYEGCLRSHAVMYDGFRRNVVYYSILKSEWPAVKEKFPISQ